MIPRNYKKNQDSSCKHLEFGIVIQTTDYLLIVFGLELGQAPISAKWLNMVRESETQILMNQNRLGSNLRTAISVHGVA